MTLLSLIVSLVRAEDRWDLQHQLAITEFPLGVRYAFTGERRHDLTERTGLLWDDTFSAPGVYAEITPAYARVGPSFHLVPIAPLDLAANVVAQGYFGTFCGVTDFPEPDSDYRDAVFDQPETDARRTGGWGVRANLTATPQVKVGRFILALPQEFYYSWMQREPGRGDYWYESQMDAMMRWSDVFMVNTGVSFWAFGDKTDEDPRFFWAGLRFDHQYVFGTGDRQVKFGPMVVFKPARPRWIPTTALFAQAWIESGGAPPVHATFPPYLVAALIW